MEVDKIIVTIIGFMAIAFTCWFFLMKKRKEVIVQGLIDIIVEGGYSPEVITIGKSR